MKEIKNKKMNKNAVRRFLLPDAHFHHDNMVDFCKRPKDFTERIIKNCQYLLRPMDDLIFLGDVIFGNKEQLKEILESIPGRKILVRGNHDRRSDTWYYDAGFLFVADEVTLGKYVLSHVPVHIREDQINIHGHFHNVTKMNWEIYLKARLTDNHYLLSLERTGYQPVMLHRAMQEHKVIRTVDFPY